MLLDFLSKIPDHRRKQGQMYKLEYVLLFSILAILSGADSYRHIAIFIKMQLKELKRIFKIKWKKAPSYGTIRYIIKGLDSIEVEKCFREYTEYLIANDIQNNSTYIALDGKVLKGSFDNFKDEKAIQVLSAFLIDEQIIIAHEEVSKKTNEIPVAQFLIEDLGLKDCVFTLDALHTQKKL